MYCCREIPIRALDAELSTTADLMNGRIVLVDDSFKILKDTFGLSRGKTLVVSDVLKAFDGETSSYLNQKKKYFYVAQRFRQKARMQRRSIRMWQPEMGKIRQACRESFF